MPNELVTKALLWERQEELPTFKDVHIKYQNGDVLVKVRTAMFGKALHRAITIGHPKIHPPRVLGTLLSGDIASENSYFPVGTRVVVNPHTVSESGLKISILPGAMSQYVKIDGPIERALYTIPESVDYSSAVYCELIACALESVLKIRDTSTLIIIGCGLMALIQIQIAKYYGIENVFCIYNHIERKKLIQKFGGIPLAYAEDVEDLKKQIFSTDISKNNFAVIDSAGSKKTLNMLLEFAEPDCKLVLFAGYPIGTSISLDANNMHYQNCQIIGCYHFEERLFREAMNLLEQGVVDIKSLITGEVNWMYFDKILENFSNTSNISNIVTFD